MLNFILPSNSNIKCEFKYTKNLRRTKYLFAIYQTSRIRISQLPKLNYSFLVILAQFFIDSLLFPFGQLSLTGFTICSFFRNNIQLEEQHL